MGSPKCNCPMCLALVGCPSTPKGAVGRFFAVFQRLPFHGAGVEVVEVPGNTDGEAVSSARFLHQQRDGLYEQEFKLVLLERGDIGPCLRVWAGLGQFSWVEVRLDCDKGVVS